MPLTYSESFKNSTHFAVWKIEESEESLRNQLQLSKDALERLSKRRSSSHRKGYLAIRQLLRSLEIEPDNHQYDGLGAPYLKDGRFISITHTKNVAAVCISLYPVGIDLEHYQKKILRVASRFLHQEELLNKKWENDIPALTQIWTAKEALYKVFRTSGIHFSKQILIHPFQKEASEGRGTVFYLKKNYYYTLNFRYFDNYCLTLATPK